MLVRTALSLVLAVLLGLVAYSREAQAQILFDASQFGAVDLVPKQSSFAATRLIETLGAQIDRFEPIADFRPDDPIRMLGRSIGRLDILVTNSIGQQGVAVCTAALIDRDKIITNHHCIPGEDDAKVTSAQIRFGYLELGTTSSVAFEVGGTPIETDKKLDYSILKMKGDPAGKFPVIALKPRTAVENERLFIIHHPAGQPQRLTRAFCRAHPASPVVNGFVHHQCDTLPGSSGSLLFAQTDGAFVGLHHAGGLSPADPKSFNEGIDAALLSSTSSALKAIRAMKTAAAAPPAPPLNLAEPACDGLLVSVSMGKSPCIKPGSGESFKDCKDCPEMVVAPAGSFMMGSTQEEIDGLVKQYPQPLFKNEGPQHQVTFKNAFAAGKYAVTFAEWDACVADGGCGGYKPSDEGWGREDRPVINVSSYDAKAYVLWLSKKTGQPYRLLSEAEREYVTRAGTSTPYWWGSSISTQQANYNGNYTYGGGNKGEVRNKTVPVRSFDPNPWGLYQVHGNVFEWVEDCYTYQNDYQGAPDDGSAWTRGECRIHVLRGGSWNNLPLGLRSAWRFDLNPISRISYIGFRVARRLNP
jgi:formylglycine-generating enzyme required for sulfatase activity